MQMRWDSHHDKLKQKGAHMKKTVKATSSVKTKSKKKLKTWSKPVIRSRSLKLDC